MVLNYKQVERYIKFPVYSLPSGEWELADGLFFVDGELYDDKNMKGETLGIRRLQSPHRIARLNRSLYNLISLVKQNNKYFIDSNGVAFIYEKTIYCQLKYYKIRRVDRKDVASVLWLKGVSSPFQILRPPEPGMEWAGILHFGKLPWKLYEYSENKLFDTRRKV